MRLLDRQSEDYHFLTVVSQLARTNPFSPRWVELEKEALGADFSPAPRVHLWTEEREREHPNLTMIHDRVTTLAPMLRARLCSEAKMTPDESLLYRDVVLSHLYRRHRKSLEELIKQGRNDGAETLWEKFSAEFDAFFLPVASESACRLSAEHTFALCFQIRRAFFHIFYYLIGTSESITQLQEDVWNSIFTHDMQLYYTRLLPRMNSFHTLITGPSGSGKELVARAIGLSQYIPFCAKEKKFVLHFGDSFRALNLAAVPSTLLESELFGHAKGAFTGAVDAQPGWLETENNSDAVFLDEIGELQHTLQAKLLRALETRKFCRVGERVQRQWRGKVIAATNRDLLRAVRESHFREDLYYRLCGDVIQTPSLRAQLDQSPGDLEHLVLSATERVIGEHDKAITSDVTNWIAENMTRDYPWPGNVRELEHMIERAIILAKTNALDLVPLIKAEARLNIRGGRHSFPTLEEAEREHILSALEETGGKVSGKGGAAELLSVPRTTLQARMRKLGIKR
jgi:sigma-54 specific flagellar transcriptional regulator A